jgi:hypothetical protein
MVRIFDIQNNKIIPSEHCYNLMDLKRIITMYPDNYMSVFSYIFYMTCPNPDLNPFFDAIETEKEELILSQLENIDFSLEDPAILKAIELCKKLYETPTLRAYQGIKGALDKLADYMYNTPITDGRDGNINSVVNSAAKFENIRMSFRGAYKDLMEEQKSQVRGNQSLAYDQM